VTNFSLIVFWLNTCILTICLTYLFYSHFQIAGWGVTENDKESDDLRYARLEFVSVDECLNWVKPDFRRYIRTTTFCAGTRNSKFAFTIHCFVISFIQMKQW
jgi:hypothetical protein